jgi:hypothetical protein
MKKNAKETEGRKKEENDNCVYQYIIIRKRVHKRQLEKVKW